MLGLAVTTCPLPPSNPSSVSFQYLTAGAARAPFQFPTCNAIALPLDGLSEFGRHVGDRSNRWVEEEFSETDLGDGRLNKRARVMVEAFSAKRTANISRACDGWTEMTGRSTIFLRSAAWHVPASDLRRHAPARTVGLCDALMWSRVAATRLVYVVDGPRRAQCEEAGQRHRHVRDRARNRAPKGTALIDWRLLTNRVAPTRDDVIELIDWYRARWEIEMFYLARPARSSSGSGDAGGATRSMNCV